MSKKLLVSLVAIFAFAFGPMPLLYKEIDASSDPRLFDCMFGYTQEQCQQFAKEAEKTKVSVTTPFLALSINKDVQNYYTNTEPVKDYIFSPTGMFLVPVFFSGLVTTILYMKYNPKQNRSNKK